MARTAQFWPKPPNLSREWEAFRAAARVNERKAKDDPTRVDPGKYHLENWVRKHKDKLAYTSDRRYHYLGSGRCYYEMGEAMAKSMLDLIK